MQRFGEFFQENVPLGGPHKRCNVKTRRVLKRTNVDLPQNMVQNFTPQILTLCLPRECIGDEGCGKRLGDNEGNLHQRFS